jgi:hypothetical protein
MGNSDQWATVRPMGNTFLTSSCVAHWSHPLYMILLGQNNYFFFNNPYF